MKIEDLFLQSTQNKVPEQLYQPIEYTLMQPGKRVRPRLVMLSTQLFGGDEKEAVYIAASFEMLHNFTLIHDDIMDKAPIRRNKETVYKKWDSNIAILSGDALATMALQQILASGLEYDKKFEITDLFARTSIEVCEGQQYDLNFESSAEVTIAEYLSMIRLKTAVMLAGCLKAGAIIGAAPEEEKQKIYDFGIFLGLAFQLKDDLLDLYADHDLFGKKKGMDIQDNKKTYLYLKALEDASETQRTALLDIFSEKGMDLDEKVSRISAIYEKLNIKGKTETLIEEYVVKALQKLDEINVVPENKTTLREFTQQLSTRNK